MAFAQIQAADWRKVCGSRRLSDQVRSPPMCCLRIEVGVNFVCTMPFHEILSLPHWTFYQRVFDCGYGNHLLRQFLNCLIWRAEAVCRALTETQRLICSECPSPWLTVQPLRRQAAPLTWEVTPNATERWCRHRQNLCETRRPLHKGCRIS